MRDYCAFCLNIFLYIIFIIYCINISFGECVEADDFGFPTVIVPAKPDQVVGEKGNQVAPWIDSNFRLDGSPLTIMVKEWSVSEKYKNTEYDLSAWCPWYGSELYNHKGNVLSYAAEFLPECTFKNDKTYPEDANPDIDEDDVPVISRPCLMKHGIGLYALIAKPRSNPNSTLDYKRYGIPDNTINFHVGQNYYKDLNMAITNNVHKFYDISPVGNILPAGGYIHKFQDEKEKMQFAGGKLYFKILDRDYDNNNGQYKVIIKSGVNNEDGGPYEFLVHIIKKMLFGEDRRDGNGLAQTLYKNIVSNSVYNGIVNITLVVFVMFSVVAFLLGDISVTSGELISRMLKLCIISVLLNSDRAWQFFYDNLFFIFLDGSEFVQQTIKKAAATGPGSADIVSLMIAPQTFKKLASLLFVDIGGIIYVIVYLLLLLYLLVIGFRSTILYCNSLILLCITIIVGPVFLCFVLFEFTKPFFERWLQQLITYAIQPIILCAGMALIGMLIRHEIYASLGFRVCQVPFLSLVNLVTKHNTMSTDTEKALIKLWFPYVVTQRTTFNKNNCSNIPIPESHVRNDHNEWKCGNSNNDTYNNPTISIQTSNNKNGPRHCAAYECTGDRYTELPFLNPADKKDKYRLNNFFEGNFVYWEGVFLLIICAGLLKIVNDNSTFVAEYISGGGSAATDATKSATKLSNLRP